MGFFSGLGWGSRATNAPPGLVDRKQPELKRLVTWLMIKSRRGRRLLCSRAFRKPRQKLASVWNYRYQRNAGRLCPHPGMDESEDGSNDGSQRTRSEVTGSGIEGFCKRRKLTQFCGMPKSSRILEPANAGWVTSAYGKHGFLHSAKLASLALKKFECSASYTK